MRTIYIGFTRPKKFKIGAYAIQKWLRVNYSHVYIRFESLNPEIPVSAYQAAHGMVHFLNFDRLKKDNIVVKEYAITVDDNIRQSVLVDCMNIAGEKYGYIELANTLLYDLGHSVGIDVKTSDNKGYICSELAGKILNKHLGLDFAKPLHILNPKDIDLRLQQANFNLSLT